MTVATAAYHQRLLLYAEWEFESMKLSSDSGTSSRICIKRIVSGMYRVVNELEIILSNYKTIAIMFWNKKDENKGYRAGMILPPPPPKTKEYKTISTLLDDAERWRNVGDKELEKQVWKMIAEKASLYADGMRENYQSGSKLQAKEVVPVFPSDRIESGLNG